MQTSTKTIGSSSAGTPHGLKLLSPMAGTAMVPGGMSRAPSGTFYDGDGRRWHYSKKTGQLVKGRPRRLNPFNPRALFRAERRVGSFVRHAAKCIRWVTPHKKGRPFPAIRRKRK